MDLDDIADLLGIPISAYLLARGQHYHDEIDPGRYPSATVLACHCAARICEDHGVTDGPWADDLADLAVTAVATLRRRRAARQRARANTAA